MHVGRKGHERLAVARAHERLARPGETRFRAAPARSAPRAPVHRGYRKNGWQRSLSMPARSNRLGSVSGGKLTPMTLAPSRCSHSASQAPLKPVWPVSRTRLPAPELRARPAVRRHSPDLPRRVAGCPELFEHGSCRAACPSAARSPCARKPSARRRGEPRAAARPPSCCDRRR